MAETIRNAPAAPLRVREFAAKSDYGEPTSTWLSYENRGIGVARFACAANHPRWHRLNHSRGHILAFPRGPVRIRSRAGEGWIVDPGLALFYAEGQEYERECIDPRGDRTEFFVFDHAALERLAPGLEPERWARGTGPLVFPVSPENYALQRLLYRYVATDPNPSERAIDFALTRLLAAVPDAVRLRERSAEPRSRRLQRHRQLAERVRERLALRLDEPLKLDDLGGELGASGPHLCRVFRETMGQTIHAYRDSLRLRASLEALESGAPDLTGLALDLGYSSHAHFTQRFSTVFRASPSRMRASLARPQVTEDPHDPRKWPRTT